MNKIENCLNCEADNGQCYECYIICGDEDRDMIAAGLQPIGDAR